MQASLPVSYYLPARPTILHFLAGRVKCCGAFLTPKPHRTHITFGGFGSGLLLDDSFIES